MKYLEGHIVIGPAPQPYPANYNSLVCQEDLPAPEPMPVLGPLAKNQNGRFTADSQAKIVEHYEKMQSWEIINQIYLSTPKRADHASQNPKAIIYVDPSKPDVEWLKRSGQKWAKQVMGLLGPRLNC